VVRHGGTAGVPVGVVARGWMLERTNDLGEGRTGGWGAFRGLARRRVWGWGCGLGVVGMGFGLGFLRRTEGARGAVEEGSCGFCRLPSSGCDRPCCPGRRLRVPKSLAIREKRGFSKPRTRSAMNAHGPSMMFAAPSASPRTPRETMHDRPSHLGYADAPPIRDRSQVIGGSAASHDDRGLVLGSALVRALNPYAYL